MMYGFVCGNCGHKIDAMTRISYDSEMRTRLFNKELTFGS